MAGRLKFNLNSYPCGKTVLVYPDHKEWAGIRIRRTLDGKDAAFTFTYKDHANKTKSGHAGLLSEGATPTSARDRKREKVARIKRERKGHPLMPPTSKGMTFSELWAEYQASRPTRTVNHDGQYYEGYLLPWFKKDFKVVNFTAPTIESYSKHLVDNDPMAFQTMEHILSALHRIVHFGANLGAIPSPPDKKSYKVEEAIDNERERYLDPDKEEIDILYEGICEATVGDWLYQLVRTSLVTGMRKGELLMMMPDWIDFKANRIDIPAFDRFGRITKNKKGRFTFFDDKQAVFLEERAHTNPRELIFATKTGNRIYPANVDRAMNKAAFLFNEELKATLDDAEEQYKKKTIDASRLRFERAYYRKWAVVFHTLRHTYATIQVSSGVPIEMVGATMGHSSERITRRYGKFIPGSVQKFQLAGHAALKRHGL